MLKAHFIRPCGCPSSYGSGTMRARCATVVCFSSSGNLNFAIEGRNLSFSVTTETFNGGKKVVLPILKECSLHVPVGQLWMLLGPNGCGKSTLLKVLADLLKPLGGTVSVRTPKSFVFQNPDHQVVMPTVEADVAFGLGKLNLTPKEVRSRVERALEAVGMLEYLQRPVQTLSGGQKQRVAIAGALAESCKVLLLDELTTFLDENDQIGVIKAVKRSLGGSDGVAALWVTHRLEELEYADGAIYMEDGRVIMHGDASAISKFIDNKQADYAKLINRKSKYVGRCRCVVGKQAFTVMTLTYIASFHGSSLDDPRLPPFRDQMLQLKLWNMIMMTRASATL